MMKRLMVAITALVALQLSACGLILYEQAGDAVYRGAVEPGYSVMPVEDDILARLERVSEAQNYKLSTIPTGDPFTRSVVIQLSNRCGLFLFHRTGVIDYQMRYAFGFNRGHLGSQACYEAFQAPIMEALGQVDGFSFEPSPFMQTNGADWD